MRSFFSAEELKGSKLSHEFKFTKGMPVLKVPYTKKYNKNIMSNINNKSLLFNIVDDPAQLNPIMNGCQIFLLTIMKWVQMQLFFFNQEFLPEHIL